MNHRVRSRLVFTKDVALNKDLVCPKPRHAPMAALRPQQVESKMSPARRLTGSASCCSDREAGHEILDILFKKTCPGDLGTPYGSPPGRASNPLIHDVHFKKQAVMVPSFLSPKYNHTGSNGGSGSPYQKKSSCSTSFGMKPFVRIEGFQSSTPEPPRGVTAFA